MKKLPENTIFFGETSYGCFVLLEYPPAIRPVKFIAQCLNKDDIYYLYEKNRLNRKTPEYFFSQQRRKFYESDIVTFNLPFPWTYLQLVIESQEVFECDEVCLLLTKNRFSFQEPLYTTYLGNNDGEQVCIGKTIKEKSIFKTIKSAEDAFWNKPFCEDTHYGVAQYEIELPLEDLQCRFTNQGIKFKKQYEKLFGKWKKI